MSRKKVKYVTGVLGERCAIMQNGKIIGFGYHFKTIGGKDYRVKFKSDEHYRFAANRQRDKGAGGKVAIDGILDGEILIAQAVHYPVNKRSKVLQKYNNRAKAEWEEIRTLNAFQAESTGQGITRLALI